MDTTVYKGERIENENILDVRTHFKPTDTFQYSHFTSCLPPGVKKKAMLKEKPSDFSEQNSSRVTFTDNIKHFKRRLISGGYPEKMVEKIISEVNYADRKTALAKKHTTHRKLLPFVTQFQPSSPCLKNILMDKWNLIQDQPLLREIFKGPPLISYRKGKLLKAKL